MPVAPPVPVPLFRNRRRVTRHQRFQTTLSVRSRTCGDEPAFQVPITQPVSGYVDSHYRPERESDGEESTGAAYDPHRACGSFCGNGRAAVVDDGFWRMFACRVPEDGRGKS